MTALIAQAAVGITGHPAGADEGKSSLRLTPTILIESQSPHRVALSA